MASSKYKQRTTEADKLDAEILELLTHGQDTTNAKELISKFRQDYTSEDCTRTLATIAIGLIDSSNPLLNTTLRSTCIRFIARISILLKVAFYDTNTGKDNDQKTA